jgi:hypothetical protein
MSNESSETRTVARNFNTVLLWTLMGGMSTVGAIALSTSLTVAEIKGKIVSRDELAAVQATISKQIGELQVQVAVIQTQLKKP